MVNSSETISVSYVSKRSRSPETPPKKLTLRVKNQAGMEDAYKIGTDAYLKKLMTAYCIKRQLDYNTVHFLFEGKEIKSRHTPAQLMMEDNDEICLVMDLGGGGPYVA